MLNHYRTLVRLRNEHEALRTGDWQPVTVAQDQPGIYASLRSTENESILVLINLGSKPVEEYSLLLENGPLTEGMQPILLMGETNTLYAPTVNATGGFSDYRPVSVLPPRSTFAIQFAP
jgi:glycosidase